MEKKLDINNNIRLEYQWLAALQKGKIINESLFNLILLYCFVTKPDLDQHKKILLLGLTEFTNNNVMYQAHPCYKNSKPWNDWVFVA